MMRVASLVPVAVSLVLLAAADALLAAELAVAATEKAEESAPPRQPLNLRAPDITKIFTAEQIQQVLAATVDPDKDIEEVEVERDRLRQKLPPNTPVVWPNLLAPFWALMHPTQAWRIIAPLPPDQAQRLAAPPEATDPYRPPPPLP